MTQTPVAAGQIGRQNSPDFDTPSASATSWGAIFAGAAAAAVLSLILLILGTGLGMSSVSPFAGQGVSATTFGVTTIVWLTFTQIVASGMGGYLAGRLRTRWLATHRDEVYFRDTAHGFLSWAVATLVTAVVLTSAIGAIVSGGVKAGATVAGGAVTAAGASAAGAVKDSVGSGEGGYFVDQLFRKSMDAPVTTPTSGNAAAQSGPAQTAEAGRIFVSAIGSGTLPADDAHYLSQLVTKQTGLSQGDAEKRVTDSFAKMKAKADRVKDEADIAAEKARKGAAYAALWMFVTLLAGAFAASFAATFGGHRRDQF